MEKTIKFVKFGRSNNINLVIGKNHVEIYGEAVKLDTNTYDIYVQATDKTFRFNGTEKDVRNYFTKLANA